MIDIEILKKEIVERLRPLEPDRIILFGSYAYGKPTEESDLDLFLLKKDLPKDAVREYKLELYKRLFAIQKKYLIGIDLFVDTPTRMQERIKTIKDQFYTEILKKGITLYAK